MSTKDYQTGYWEYKIVDEPAQAVIEEQETFLNTIGKDGWENYKIEAFSFHHRRFYFKMFIKTPPKSTKSKRAAS